MKLSAERHCRRPPSDGNRGGTGRIGGASLGVAPARGCSCVPAHLVLLLRLGAEVRAPGRALVLLAHARVPAADTDILLSARKETGAVRGGARQGGGQWGCWDTRLPLPPRPPPLAAVDNDVS